MAASNGAADRVTNMSEFRSDALVHANCILTINMGLYRLLTSCGWGVQALRH